MTTPATPIDQLRPIFDRLRAAHLAHIPSYGERLASLERLEAAVRKYADEVVEACSSDFGRRAPLESRMAEVVVTVQEIAHARKHLRRWMRPEKRRVNWTFLPARGEIRYTPLGVVGVVAPWNYPFQLVIVPLASAIAAGNRVMVKPSEFTPRVQEVLSRLIAEVFSPDEVALVHGEHELSAAFTRLPFDHILFTGSTAVGRQVMAAAAANLTPVTLELGGKCPALIAPDYPIEHAADRIAFGKFFNGGQTCVAPDYVLVPRARRDDFVSAFMASVARRYPSLAGNPDYTVTINARQANRLRDWLADAERLGVKSVQYQPAGETPPEGLELLPPTVVLDPPPEAILMREEIFGPVLVVCSYDDHDAALAGVLQRDKPLAFYAFDRNHERAEKTLDRVCAGMACVNDVVIQFGQSEFPIGGVGASGMGAYHGHTGFLTFSKAMPVMYQSRLNGMKLLDPPYSKLAYRLVSWLTRA